MERLAEQIVDWHNRHPLARRIAVGDVHTIGVVALPFIRATAQSGGFAEPVLTDAVSAFDDLHGLPPASRWAVGTQRLKALPQWLQQLLKRERRTQWRAFSEKFLPGLSLRRIERFALAHGFEDPPATPETRPWRVIVIDEQRASARPGWPFELYVMTAGIDTGSARTRVLSGRGIPSQIIGRRLWDPLRLAASGGVLALLLALGAWSLWPHRSAEPLMAAAEPAASDVLPAAASAEPEAAASATPAEPASAASAASAPEPAASQPDDVASAPEDADSAPVPDIRPRLVQRADGKVVPPLLRSKPADTPADASAAAPTPDRPADKATARTGRTAADKPAAEPADPRLARMAAMPDKPAVALVGPPGTKAEAEALLQKMKAGLVGVHSNPDSLQADVIQTPEGWRATVWPFPSREQAQLINATLVARGLKTKAVNF
ncbi:hypothetical protein [Pelomonas cellulosilytica]|uniref:SPOR domain-containing protein n=1 Tax=Pelomonas cellulosilytica TaxID=2906762 RepID=A0ABS8XZQ9_9BURK|nr:hypothetical protein [Pelomonas sp. P8]MCE4557180.1 hypothetical protein [Pelomonas sp. P8]